MRQAVILLTLVVAGCGGKTHEYRSEEGRFVVRFPGPPDDSRNPDLPAVVRQVRLEQQSGTLSVAWEPVELKEGVSAEERLEQAVRSATTQLKGKQVWAKAVNLGKSAPGRDALLAWPEGDGVVRVRFYLAGSRLYSVLASGAKWWVESSPTRAFLDSFALVEE